MLNLHGLKIEGLEKVSAETHNYDRGSGRYDEIFYERSTGEVWTVPQCNLGHNSWTQYRDEDIIKVCNATRHMSMQHLADMIAKAVVEADQEAAWEAKLEQEYRDFYKD